MLFLLGRRPLRRPLRRLSEPRKSKAEAAAIRKDGIAPRRHFEDHTRQHSRLTIIQAAIKKRKAKADAVGGHDIAARRIVKLIRVKTQDSQPLKLLQKRARWQLVLSVDTMWLLVGLFEIIHIKAPDLQLSKMKKRRRR